MGFGDCDDSVCTSIPQDLDFISSDEGVDEPPSNGGDAAAPRYFTKKLSSSGSTMSPPSSKGILSSSNNLLPMYASCTDLEMTEDEGEMTANEESAANSREVRISPPR